MREIKFRGQKKDNKEWVQGFFVETLDIKNEDALPPFELKPYIFQTWNDSVLDFSENGGVYEAIADTIGQFTGLKDKNGVEIYEGDILKAFDRFFEVVFSDGAFYMKLKSAHQRLSRVFIIQEEIEVIGNIHSNP